MQLLYFLFDKNLLDLQTNTFLPDKNPGCDDNFLVDS